MQDIMDTTPEGVANIKRMSRYSAWTNKRLRNAMLGVEKALTYTKCNARRTVLEHRFTSMQSEHILRLRGNNRRDYP